MKIGITGGHLSPALAVIKKLPQDNEVIFLGRKYGIEGDKAVALEYKTISDMGIKFYELKTGRLQRKLTKHTLLSMAKIPFGILQAVQILQREKPDVVLTFGGYIAFPVALAAYILKIPVVIHEQTLEAGLANKALAPFATKICISWETSKKFFNAKKTVLTGNPIRPEIEREDLRSHLLEHVSSSDKVLYITGGSLGSHAINTLVEVNLEKLLQKYVIIHQTGDAGEFQDFDRLEEEKKHLEESFSKRYILTKFVSPTDVGAIMRRADLVIGRSGVNTVSELLFLKKPALFIPLPFAQAQEQKKNALYLKKLGLAEVKEQKDLTADELYTTINYMMDNISSYKISGAHEEYNSLKNAAENIINVLAHVVKKN